MDMHVIVIGLLLIGALVATQLALAADADSQLAGAPANAPASKAVQSTTTPVSRAPDKWWLGLFEKYNERARQGNVDLLLLGDSITQNFRDHTGKKIYERYYSDRNVADMGIGGDGTQHILWRLDHGNIDGISPKVVVLMAGTNNSNGDENTPQQIADGIAAIVQKLRTKLPNSKILLLGIFPRDEKPDAQREKVLAASDIAAKLADGKTVFYLDLRKEFLPESGIISKDILWDFVHPTERGYELWARAMEPTLAKLLGDKPKSFPESQPAK